MGDGQGRGLLPWMGRTPAQQIVQAIITDLVKIPAVREALASVSEEEKQALGDKWERVISKALEERDESE